MVWATSTNTRAHLLVRDSTGRAAAAANLLRNGKQLFVKLVGFNASERRGLDIVSNREAEAVAVVVGSAATMR